MPKKSGGKRTRETICLIEATGHTNEVIAGKVDVENTRRILCRDGRKRDFWECSWSFASKLEDNRGSGQLKFNVYYQEGREGVAKPWRFTKRSKAKMTLAAALKTGRVKRVQRVQL